MERPGFESNDPDESEATDASEGHRDAERDARALLEHVIQQTLVTPSPADSATPDDLAALREVVNRHRGEPFAVDPIGVELVQAMLRSYFETWCRSPEPWLGLARKVARSLCDDPVLHERTRKLWRRLGESAS
jgi:hypothetical protein